MISWPEEIKIGAKNFLKIAKFVSPWFHSKIFEKRPESPFKDF